MASASASGRAATAELVRSGVAGGVKGRLGSLQLVCADPSGAEQFCAVYLVRCRSDGFLALFPALEIVEETVDGFNTGGGETALKDRLHVAIETPRGRRLGTTDVLIMDLPWHYLPLFRKCTSRSGSGGNQILFRFGDTVGRPVETMVLELSQTWVNSMLDVETANEYTDALETPGDQEDLDGEPFDPGAASTGSREAELTALRNRVAQLEQVVTMQSAHPAVLRAAPPPTSSLLQRPEGTPELTPAELQKLRSAVGPAPRRLGKGDSAVPLQGRQQNLETLVSAEIDREVLPEEEEPGTTTDADAPAAVPQFADPVHQLLALQMKQTADLMKALAPKVPSDPLSAILSGGDSGSGASSSGSINVKGYAAREAFLRQIEDDKKVVQVIRANARQELGISEAKEEASLLRTYLEQRIPVGDLKTMGQLGYMMAFGWEQACLQNNIQMMAFCGKMMVYVEQTCLDAGKTHLSWMLTGLMEPNHQLLATNRRRASLSPFAKLPSPTWVAANVSYMKDIDVFETRLRQLGSNRPNVPQSPAEPFDNAPKFKPKPKKPKGGKGANQSSEEPPTS